MPCRAGCRADERMLKNSRCDEPAVTPAGKPDDRNRMRAKIAEIEANLKTLQDQLKKLK